MGSIEIRITDSAYSDLIEIERFIRQSSPRIGRVFINKIFKKIDLLYQYPLIGRKVPEFDDDRIRELPQGKYRIVYKISREDLIEILRVLHGSRLIDIG